MGGGGRGGGVMDDVIKCVCSNNVMLVTLYL